jgi:hypothetical protein
MGEWRYSSTILNLGTRWSGQLHVPAALPPGKQPTVTTVQEAGWLRAGLDVVEKRKISCLYRESNPDC